jgi:hypothetical protein
MIRNDPSATTELHACRVEDCGILCYMPVRDSERSIRWDTTDLHRTWEPGNFCFEMSNAGMGVYYGNDSTYTETIQQRELERGSVVRVFIDFCCNLMALNPPPKLVITGHSLTCAIEPQSTKMLDLVWIIAPNYYMEPVSDHSFTSNGS